MSPDGTWAGAMLGQHLGRVGPASPAGFCLFPFSPRPFLPWVSQIFLPVTVGLVAMQIGLSDPPKPVRAPQPQPGLPRGDAPCSDTSPAATPSPKSHKPAPATPRPLRIHLEQNRELRPAWESRGVPLHTSRPARSAGNVPGERLDLHQLCPSKESQE